MTASARRDREIVRLIAARVPAADVGKRFGLTVQRLGQIMRAAGYQHVWVWEPGRPRRALGVINKAELQVENAPLAPITRL
jgi:hypothetical protein